MSIKNSPLLTCTFYSLSAVGCSHSLHHPEAAEDTSDKMEGVRGDGDFTKSVDAWGYFCSTDFTTDDVVEHLSSYPCYFTHISTWRWNVQDPHLFSVSFLVHVATSLRTSESLCVIHLPSVAISTPSCDNNVSMENVVLQVAICMWHHHLSPWVPATGFISNLTNQLYWY